MISSVNPKIGTGKRGNCLIGPCLPFGMVRLGPDIAYPQPNSGYRPGKAVIGFSHTRLSGTGGAGRYGNIRVMPFVGDARVLKGPPFLTFPATDRNWSKPVEEDAEVGYYRGRFSFGVEAELTATAHVGIHRYTFAAGSRPFLLIDFASLLQAGVAPAGQSPYCEDWEMEGRCIGGEVDILNDHEITGRSDFQGGWGHYEPYSIFYFIRSREGFSHAQLVDNSGLIYGSQADGSELRVGLTYAGPQINLEVGISFRSIAEAKQSVETESAGDSFEKIRERARAAWIPWLNRVEVEGGTADQTALLSTSMLRLFTMPTDLGEESTPRFTDITCLWDSIRNANSLYHLIAPEFSADLMNSLLRTADQTGWLPDADIAGKFAYQQSGCSAEILFSEAARKGVPGVDYRRALAACVRNAETPSPEPAYYGRYLDDYENLGFLCTNVPKGCVSRHLEYTYQDWCIARLAELLGETEIAARFDAKSQRLWNLWNDEFKCFLPKHPDGSWVAGVDPEHHIWDGWNDPYSYEGALGYWSFCGLQDIPGLIARHGGDNGFTAFLDGFLSKHSAIEKETRMIIPHLYAFAGKPERTAELIHRSLRERYLNSPDGLPDDEDMGCQSAFYVGNSVGLYPIYGQTFYSVVPPTFERSVLRYGNTGKSLTILRKGSGPHVKSLSLNGRLLVGTLIEHTDIADGGALEITV